MIKHLTPQIGEDVELYYAYQANIAMAFFDAYYRNKKKYMNREDIHRIANEGAKDFLNLLIREK